MAVAVKNKVDDRPASAAQQLAAASFVGALYLLASALVVMVALPWAWAKYLTPTIDATFGSQTFVNSGGLMIAGVVLAVLLFLGFRAMAGATPPAGFRAGVSAAISLLIASFFLTTAITEWVARSMPMNPTTGAIVLGLVAALLVGASVALMLSPTTHNGLVVAEAGGWFSLESYKKTQGVRVRRFTLLGAIILVTTGVWSLQGSPGMVGDWRVSVPFLSERPITVLPSVQWTIPLILLVVGLWFSWRLVNTPVFADFLIATDAELNKVSWTSRKQLIRDTIVVLVAVLLLTLFLLVVDQVWGWLFRLIGIVPTAAKSGAAVMRDAGW